MLWVVRWVLVGLLISAGVLFWWYPTPTLYYVHEPDWAAEYERQFSPQSFTFGAYGAGMEFLREIRAFQPLSEYILEHSERGGQTSVSAAVWETIESNPSEYFRPGPLFSSGYLQGYLRHRDTSGFQFRRYQRLTPQNYGNHSIPPELQFPLRTHAFPVIAFLVLSVFLTQRLSVDPRLAYGTLGPPIAVLSLLFSGGLLLLLWPLLFSMIDTDMAMASMFFGGFLALTMLLVLIVFGGQIRMLRRLTAGEDVLLRWEYGPDEWEQMAEYRRIDLRTQQLRAWVIVSGVVVLVSGFLAFQIPSLVTQVLFVGILVLSALWRFLQLTVLWKRPSDMGVPPQTIIGTHGAYCDGELHRWGGFGARFHEALISKEPHPTMHISYSVLTGHSTGSRSVPMIYWQKHGLDVPIPAGKLDEAEQAAQALTEFLE